MESTGRRPKDAATWDLRCSAAFTWAKIGTKVYYRRVPTDRHDRSRRPGKRPASLRRRLASFGALWLSVLLVFTSLSALGVREWTVESTEQRELQLSLEDVRTIRLAYSDQQTGVRGYVLSGDTAYLDPYREGLLAEERAFGRLEARFQAVEDFDAGLVAVQAAAQRWHTNAAKPLIADRQASSRVDRALLETGKKEFDRLRVALDSVQRIVESRNASALSRVEWLRRVSILVLVGGLASMLVGAFFAFACLSRWVTRPLALVSESAREIARNERVRMPEFSSAEFQDVADDIDLLQRSLVEERDRAVRAYKSIEQTAILALEVRSDLANVYGEAPHGWSIASSLRSAEGIVAGDCFDVGLISPTRAYVVVIDVTGHGAHAALAALKSKSALRLALRAGLMPGAAMERLAQHQEHDSTEEFLTAFAAVIDIANGTCQYANAGHPPGLIVSDSSIEELANTGPIIGAFRSEWTTESRTIPIGGSLIIYSDGLTEARGFGSDRLGEGRVRDRLASTGRSDAPAVVASLTDLYDNYRVGPQTDDVTLVVLGRLLTASPSPMVPPA